MLVVVHHNALGEPGTDGVNNVSAQDIGDDGAADGSALLPRFDGHFRDHRFDELVEFRRTRDRVGAKDCSVERVRFAGEADTALGHVWVCAQLLRGAGGTGKGDHVPVVKLVQHVACGARE